MKYQVFEGDKPADCFHTNVNKSWNKSIYDSFEEACIYAIFWCWPIGGEEGREYAKNAYYSHYQNVMKLNESIDLSYCEFPVMMTVKEIE